MTTGDNDSSFDGSGKGPAMPLRLLYVQSHWLARKVAWWLMQDVPCIWTYAGNAAEALAKVGVSSSADGGSDAESGPEPGEQAARFDVVIVDHEQAEGSGLRIVRMLRDAGYKGPIIAITVDEVGDIEKTCYENLDTPLLLLLPDKAGMMKNAVAEAATEQAGRDDASKA
ncbi:response regulator [Opitutaceae bacterium TAV4]|nr:response regulator [Opitutaceae bacterium TAV4]RRK00936.1 response regulator [Opitutaceae bacterium TAV3]